MSDVPRFIPPWRCASIHASFGWTRARALVPIHFAPVELCWRWRGHRGEHAGRLFGAAQETDSE